jgi:hypothetical protein
METSSLTYHLSHFFVIKPMASGRLAALAKHMR